MAIRIPITMDSESAVKQGHPDRSRIKIGLQKIREALISDAKLASSRPSGLPKDWRNRVFK